ncbi:MAG: DoxX family protein [Deltaproteobacteria bacterium]|nr:DoxX family protein [Deltaproteobacteria bacterium]
MTGNRPHPSNFLAAALAKGESLYGLFTKVANALPHPLLAVMRGYWGYQFFLTGKGKLSDLASVTEFFASLGIPAPHFNAMMAGATECVGGLLLLVGLGSRLVSVPLSVTMMVAYATAHREALLGIFADPDTFLQQTPFLFLLTAVVVLAFGPGYFSLDTIVKRLVDERRAVRS